MSQATTPHRGRPRNADLDARVLEAARSVLLENGYPGFSIEEVSRASGVPKSSIYLRWPGGRPDLVLVAAFPRSPTEFPRSDDPVADLFALAGHLAAELATPIARMAVAGVLSEISSPRVDGVGFSPDVRRLLDRVFRQRRRLLAKLFSEAREAHELSSALPSLVIADAVLGLCVYRSATHQPLSAKHTSALLRTLLAGVGFV